MGCRLDKSRIRRWSRGIVGGVLVCAPGVVFAGAVHGKVVVAGAVPPSKKLDVTIDQYVCGTQKDAGDLLVSAQKELQNAVVWLENPPANAAWPTAARKVEVDQKACVFIPRVVVVPAGGTVDFLNSDRRDGLGFRYEVIHADPGAGTARVNEGGE